MKKRHNVEYTINHLKVLKALNEGKKTNYEIFLQTNLTPRTVYEHKKEIVKCSRCNFFTDKQEFCLFCRFRLNGDNIE